MDHDDIRLDDALPALVYREVEEGVVIPGAVGDRGGVGLVETLALAGEEEQQEVGGGGELHSNW